MPAAFDTLYELVAENVPYHSAALFLTTTDNPGGRLFGLGNIGEPTVAGYSRWTEQSLLTIFPDPHIVPGDLVRLVSRNWTLRNASNTPLDITGIGLLVFVAPDQPRIVAVNATPTRWNPDTRIAGRLSITSKIYTD